MNEAVTQAGYDWLLRRDFASFARRAFAELNPQTARPEPLSVTAKRLGILRPL